MAPRFIFAALSVTFAIAVISAVVTTVKHVPRTRAGCFGHAARLT
jgi:hypothetical protein